VKYALFPALLLLAGIQPALAVIYQWKDEGGVMHYTDNLNQVPPKHRKEGLAELHEPAPSAGVSQVKNPDLKPVKYRAWEEKCAGCHHAGEGARDGLLGLAHLTINKITRFPAGEDEVVEELRYATSGRYSDMARMDVTDEELHSIARYLLNANK